MINIENVEVWGFDHAIRGMRNPLNSWDKIDSAYDEKGEFNIGPKDLKLMQMLLDAGPEHRKYLRQIFISFDITAPLYWWKEFDTYKIGTVSNSCSTMHTITKTEFNTSMFSIENLNDDSKNIFNELIKILNKYREEYLNIPDCIDRKNIWWQLIQLLPTSFNQKRTITMNYENALNIIHQRTGHKLNEWRDFANYLQEKLPYMNKINRFMDFIPSSLIQGE